MYKQSINNKLLKNFLKKINLDMLPNNDATMPNLQLPDTSSENPTAHAQIQDKHLANYTLILQQSHDRDVELAIVPARPMGSHPSHLARREPLQAQPAHQRGAREARNEAPTPFKQQKPSTILKIRSEQRRKKAASCHHSEIQTTSDAANSNQ